MLRFQGRVILALGMTLVVCGLLGVFCVRAAAPAGGQARIGPLETAAPLTQVVVYGADAPNRASGLGRYLCNGTFTTGGDQVQLQAAINSLDKDGDGVLDLGDGGVVEIRGTLYYSNPTGQTAWAGTGTTSTVAGQTLITVTAWGTGTIADVTVGQVLRLSQTGGGTDPATNYDDVIYTVAAKAAGPDTITLHSQLHTNYGAPGVDFTRLIPAVTVPSGVSIVGGQHWASRLKAIDGTTSSAILVKGNFTRLESFDIRPVTDAAAYDGRQNGIIVASGSNECTLRDVSVWYVGGDGFTFDHGHGVRVASGDSWAEGCRGRGYVAVGASELTIDGAMPELNYKDGILIHRSDRVSVNNCYSRHSAAFYSLHARWSNYLCVRGNRWVDNNAAVVGLLNLVSCNYGTVSGNTFGMLLAAAPTITESGTCYANTISDNVIRLYAANSTGVDLTTGQQNVLVGNAFYPAGSGSKALNVERGNYGTNTIHGNVGTTPVMDCRITTGKNTTAGTLTKYYAVQHRVSAAGQVDCDEMEAATSATCRQFLGSLQLADAAAGATGTVQTEGACLYQYCNGTTAIAIGDPLKVSAATAGVLIKATASGDFVVGKARVAYNGGSDAIKKVYILPPGQRYFLP